ncbi:hypothetical protein M1247_12270 [Mycobacterium sp. 21AC1]|uniref:hypothetical protein n=1 Tax=[Mycobacterium] appelbergii TaxID=2939269 RepID=UPI0029393980|nr:hypothetical protein [Mycobacterium sp. 21AC1]MDV3125693.1 hypothetical protein [Mycobacterium sp. 21AC1]
MSTSPPPDSGSSGPEIPEPGESGGSPPPMWDQLFELDGVRRGGHAGVLPRSTSGTPRRRRPLILAGAVVVVAVVVLVAWLLWPAPGNPNEAGSNATESSTAAAEAQERLSGMVPAGYRIDSCSPAGTPDAALAKVSCGANTDPNGPPMATYTLVADKAALTTVFNEVVKASTTVECPGRIQSPGPWRRNATPKQVSGTLFCGLQQNRPVVAWTDEARLMMGEARAGAQGPTFPQLYAWWSAHS